MRNRQFQDLLLKVENRLKNELGKNYCGLLSIAREIASLYLHKHQHLYYKEHEYITELRKDLLMIALLEFFSTNRIQFIRKFNFERALTKIELELYRMKKIILYKWITGETNEELKKLQNTKKLDTYEKMYLNLLKYYPVFEASSLKEFKKELGL